MDRALPHQDSRTRCADCNSLRRQCPAGRARPGTAKVLIAANPCFGLDFAAVDFIHSKILAARNQGVAILLICEDLDQLLALSDRVLVMAGGKVVYEAPVSDADIRVMGERMAGH